MPDIVSDLYPDPASVSPDVLQSVRRRLVANTAQKFATLDTRPGSVHGDMSISPDTWRIAVVETGLNGILSDLDLDNVIAGNVFSCDFVTQYLRQLGVIDRPNGSSTGEVRLFLDRATLD